MTQRDKYFVWCVIWLLLYAIAMLVNTVRELGGEPSDYLADHWVYGIFVVGNFVMAWLAKEKK